VTHLRKMMLEGTPTSQLRRDYHRIHTSVPSRRFFPILQLFPRIVLGPRHIREYQGAALFQKRKVLGEQRFVSQHLGGLYAFFYVKTLKKAWSHHGNTLPEEGRSTCQRSSVRRK